MASRYFDNAEIIELFGEEPKILATLAKDTSESYQEGLLELYKKIRPGEPLAVEIAESLIMNMFFDPKRYDLAKVGRYKFNKKLLLKNRVAGQILAEDVVDVTTGEILAEAGVAGDSIIVATGKAFADSLSASAAKLPILLVKPNAALSEEAKARKCLHFSLTVTVLMFLQRK